MMECASSAFTALCYTTALFLLCLSAPAPAVGQDPLSIEPADRDWSRTLGIDLGSLVSPPSLLMLGLAGTASAWSWDEIDQRQNSTRRYLDGSFLDPVFDIGSAYGSGWVAGAGSLSVLAAGRITGSEKLDRMGSDLCRSFMYSGLTTGVLKFGINRRRPAGGPLSFPSGHATSAFSTVPVIWHHLGWSAGVGASLLALSTGVGRMEENRHYLSDIIFGATVGLIVGRAVIAQRRQDDWRAHLVVSGRQAGLAWNF